MAALALFALLYCGLRTYTGYLTHRAISLLDEATRIQVGATEDSILPLVSHYRGVRWTPPPPTPIDDCPKPAECEYRNVHIPNYAYPPLGN
jgi:hypothetical protein